jgi:hypothetical protein
MVFPRFHGRLVLGLAIVWLSFGLAAPVFGQWGPRRPPRPDQPTLLPAKLEGTVTRVASGELEISAHAPSKDAKDTPQDTPWTVGTTSTTTFRVTGEAKPDYLRPGYTVEFTATIDPAQEKEKTIVVQDKIAELKLVTPTRGTPAGHKASKKSEGEAATTAGPQDVVGRLGQFKEHKWTVLYRNKKLQIQLADDVKISVDMTGPTARHLISPGDEIVVDGQIIRNRPGPCQANDIQVKLAHPLTAPKKAKRSSSSSR